MPLLTDTFPKKFKPISHARLKTITYIIIGMDMQRHSTYNLRRDHWHIKSERYIPSHLALLLCVHREPLQKVRLGICISWHARTTANLHQCLQSRLRTSLSPQIQATHSFLSSRAILPLPERSPPTLLQCPKIQMAAKILWMVRCSFLKSEWVWHVGPVDGHYWGGREHKSQNNMHMKEPLQSPSIARTNNQLRTFICIPW